mmetsp:Transcript_21093/g.50366  ORF Transcript_21093/g.50366 Transcript_21093/m.50366 type:complete len:195 (+) Transcript_21093:373-957(+)
MRTLAPTAGRGGGRRRTTRPTQPPSRAPSRAAGGGAAGGPPPPAGGAGEPLADEVVRLVDTYMAGAIREQIGRGPAGVDAAKRLVPMGPKEEASLARSRSILQRLGSLQPARRRSIAVQGNGPFGTMTPQEFQRTIADVREGLLARYPRVQQLLSSPGAQEMLNKVSQGLLARATARTLRLVLGIGSRPEPESR